MSKGLIADSLGCPNHWTERTHWDYYGITKWEPRSPGMFMHHRILGANWSRFRVGTCCSTTVVRRNSAALLKNSSGRSDNMQTKTKKLGTLTLVGTLMAG